MRSIIHQFFVGKENRTNGLIALSIVSLIVLGCTCNLGNPWQKENNPPASNTYSPPENTATAPIDDSKTPSPSITKTPVILPAKTPEPPPVANIPPPVEVAYIHFLEETHREFGRNMKVGSPKKSGTRIEVRVEANGETETLVVTQKTNNGHKATVIVGPKDAGAVRSYTLTLSADGWKITGVTDLNG